MKGGKDLRISADHIVRQSLITLLILIVLVGPVAGISVNNQEALDTEQSAIQGNNVQNVITVGENGTYSRLQNALKNANRGDTIQVGSGTYYQVYISKQVTLIGIDTGGGKPVIDGGGSGPVIQVGAPGVTIDGFHITNMGNNAEGGVKTTSGAHDLTVANTTFSEGDIALNLRDREMNHRIYLNDFSGISQTVELNEDRDVTIYWNTSEKMTYWWDGEQFSGRLGNYYGERVFDKDGDGVGDEPRQMGIYAWKNKDNAPLNEPPWKYFEKGSGTSSASTKTFTPVEEDEQTMTENSGEYQESSSLTDKEPPGEDMNNERQRGFFSNSSNEPEFLSNALNLTVLGFVLSVAGIIQQLLGGR